GEADEQALVDGYANGWLVTPSGEGEVAIELRWTPQRIRWVGFGVSGATLLACAAILWRTRSRREASVVGVGATPLAAKPGVAALRDRARSGDHTSAVTAGAATLAAGL